MTDSIVDNRSASNSQSNSDQQHLIRSRLTKRSEVTRTSSLEQKFRPSVDDWDENDKGNKRIHYRITTLYLSRKDDCESNAILNEKPNDRKNRHVQKKLEMESNKDSDIIYLYLSTLSTSTQH
jgi:hypothetical protein